MKIHFEGPPGTAEQSRGLHVDYAAARRNIPAWRWNLIVLVLLSPVLYLLGKGLLEQLWIAAPGRVELRETTLHAGQAGRVAFIAAAGSRVEAGALLAVIAPPATAAPAAPPPAADRRAEMSAAGELFAYRRERLSRYRQLWRQGAATQAELAQALAQLAEAETGYRRIQADTTAGSATGQPASPAEFRITAPYPGIVTHLTSSPGDWATAGAELLTLVDDAEAQVVAYLDPRHTRYAEPGRSARLRFPDGDSLSARVAQIRVDTARSPEPQGALTAGGSAALQLVLRPEGGLPQRYRRQRLPIEVRFDFAWPWASSGSG